MACLISDIVVTAVDDGAGAAASVTVTGRAEDCPSRRVLVKLFCGGTPVGFQSVAVGVDGRGSATFDEPGCACGGNVRVEAECEGTPGCVTIVEDELECTPPEGECPAVDEVRVTVGECDDGRRTVTFEITTNAADAAAVELEFGDGDSDAFAIEAGVDTTTIEHPYEAGVYVPTLRVILPEGCPEVALDEIEIEECVLCLDAADVEIAISDCMADGTRHVTFTFPARVSGELDFGDGESAGFDGWGQTHPYVPRDEPYTATLRLDGCLPIELEIALDPCPPGCLDASQVEVSVDDDCDADRRRTATFVLSRPVTGEIEFGDDSPPAEVDGDRVTHAYPADVSPETRYTAVLTVDGCEPIEIVVAVPACPCVVAAQVQVTPDDECDEDGNRRVTFTFPWEVTGELDYGDGESEDFTDSTRAHTYTPADDPYAARLTVRGCAAVELSVDVPPCDGGDGDGDGEPSICGKLDLVVGALLGLALAASLILLAIQCRNIPVPWFFWLIPAAFAAAAGVVIVLWYLFCDPPTACDWLAIAWMVALTGAIVALYLSACCPFMLPLSIVLFVAAAAGFGLWVLVCHPTPCGILRHLAVALSTAAGGVLGAFGLVVPFLPALAGCVLGWVPAAVAVVAGAVVLLALLCEDG